MNVDKAVDIYTRQMHDFQKKLPSGFYDTISKKVQTVAAMKKSMLGVRKSMKIWSTPE